MTEFARGGIVRWTDTRAVVKGCEYIIPMPKAKILKEALDRLNEGGVNYVEVVDSPDSIEEGI